MKKEIVAGYVWPGRWDNGDDLVEDHYKEYYPDIDPNEIILEPNSKFKLVIDYPLSRPFEVEFKTDENGMTRYNLMVLCVESYKYVYDKEDETTTIEPQNIPGMLNRIFTNGKFGIWGHDIGDLTIHTFYINNNVIELGVDS